MLCLQRKTNEWLCGGDQFGHLQEVQAAIVGYAELNLSQHLFNKTQIGQLVQLKPTLGIIRNVVYKIL